MKGLLLISSGIDSPVAGYIMIKRGVEIIAVHFNNLKEEDDKSLRTTKRLVKKLSQIANKRIKLYIIQNHRNQRVIMDNTNRRFQCVLCKRLMYRMAERIAKKEKCDFLITGENLGQVASQTLDNLKVLDDATDMIVLRPLLCNDKNDTIKIAKQIGTYDISIEHKDTCAFVPKRPLTKAKLEKVKVQEEKLDIQKIVDDSIKNAESVLIS
ncbi:hypothetical protein A3K72_03085 [Candidatus Woesearchaeota archaeon RBG_13_36_6]|nr:MAG: hypothetical protein A3K72_03085 [Candidatus Woesearchaeota archaeon RBG_13_36_6]